MQAAPQIDPKIDFNKKSIFTLITEESKKHDAINLGQGFPGFPCSPLLLELLQKNIASVSHQYAPTNGLPIFREKIARKLCDLYGANYDVENEITVIPGATYGIFTSISAFVKAKDKVVVFEPYYENYLPSIRLQGATPVIVKLPEEEQGWEEFDKLYDADVKAIILNSPHNPSTKMLGAGFLRELHKRIQNFNTLIFSDEVYEHLTFDGARHLSLIAHPDLAKRSVGVFSFGKTYSITGWKTGYAVAPKEIMSEFRKAHANQIFCVNPLLQQTLADFMDYPDEYLQLGKFYQEKRDALFEGLKSATNFEPIQPQGTFFMLADYGKISRLDDQEFSMKMIQKHKVSSIPISPFHRAGYNKKLIRLCFAQNVNVLQKAIENLSKIKEI